MSPDSAVLSALELEDIGQLIPAVPFETGACSKDILLGPETIERNRVRGLAQPPSLDYRLCDYDGYSEFKDIDYEYNLST
jgi:hypothetical protein